MSINENLKKIGLFSRICIVVFLKNISDQYKLRKYGDIVYFSKKMKYCVLYVTENDLEKVKDEITSLTFVKNVEVADSDSLNLNSDYLENQITKMSKEAEEKISENKELLS